MFSFMHFLKNLTEKQWYLGIAMFCAGLLIGAVIIQTTATLVPCPLCVAQRIFFLLVGLSALAGYFGWLEGIRVRLAAWLMLGFSLIGGSIAVRQVLLQHFPPADIDPTICVVSFGSFLDSFLRALGGVGNCAIRDFTLIGLALPEWSLLSFAGLIVVMIWLMWIRPMTEN